MIKFIEMKIAFIYVHIYNNFPRCLCSVTIGPVGGTDMQGPVHGLFKTFPVGGGLCKDPIFTEGVSFPLYGFE